MNRHSSEITTIDVTTGAKYTVRKKFVPRTFALTSSARSSASPAWTGTTTTAKYAVLRNDSQKSWSPKSLMKLSSPDEPGRARRRSAGRW